MGLVGKLPPTAVINFGADPIGGGVVWNHCSRETMKNGNLLFEISPICNPFQFKCDFLFRLFCLRGCNSQFLFLNYGANLIYYPLKRGAVRELYFRCYFFWRASLLGWGTVYPPMLLARGSIQGRRWALDRRWKGSGWILEDVRWDVWKMDSHACLGCPGNFILV